MIKALYVDDDEDIASIVEMCLEMDGGFEVRVKHSGRDGVVEAMNWRPDVILLDYMMPEMDGPSTLIHLREHMTTKAIPVIFITAKSMREDVSMLLEMGAIGVISKPFDPETLASDIRKLVSG
jgi:DNA-binding response OmpR family regulator